MEDEASVIPGADGRPLLPAGLTEKAQGVET